jgi:hypothetical protein
VANTLGNFSVPLYSVQALRVLQNTLHTPSRVNRAYDVERRAFNKGEVVNIRRPSTFTVYDAPIAAGSVDDAKTESVQVALNLHKEVKLKITDKELAYTTEAFIQAHVNPMAYSLANYIDAQLLELALEIPHFQDITVSSATPTVLTTAGKIMTENRVPEDGRRHYAASPGVWQKWLDSSNFAQWQGAGQSGAETQRTGLLDQKFGYLPYQSNNLVEVAAPSAPTITTPTNITSATKGATSITLAAATLTGTIKRGMVLQFGAAAAGSGKAYNDQVYAVTADATASGNAVTVSISPPLRADLSNVAWSRKQVRGDLLHRSELAFHSDALALVMVPLPDKAMGADVTTATDDTSGLSVRSRLFYDGNLSAHFFAMDVLFGRKVLDADLAVRGAAA